MKLIVAILFYSLLSQSMLYADELKERKIIFDMGSKLIKKNDFKTLTELANKYMKNESRTSSGKWKLRLLYKGIFSTFNMDMTDKKYWNDLEKNILKWTKDYPNEPISHIVYGSLIYHKAWMYRGSSYAKNVKKNNWTLFYKELNKAKKYISDHKTIAFNDPQWYVLMLSIARGESLNEKLFEKLFDEALKKYPDYYPIYEYALHYMSPNWNNFTKEEIEKNAKRVLNISKDEDGTYARYYLMANDIIYRDSLFYSSNLDWSLLSKSIDKVLKKYPTQYNINNFAYLSCLSNNKDKTIELMNKITDKSILKIWKNNENFNRCNELDKNNKYTITTIKPNELYNHIQKNNTDKPQLFYFSSYKNNCKVCDINLFYKLEKDFKNKINFISVNLSPENKIYKFPYIYRNFYINSTPSLMLVYKKKIVRRIINVNLSNDNKYVKHMLNTTLLDLKNLSILEQFKELIVDKASYLNSNDTVRIVDYNYRANKNKYKARAYAVSLRKNRFAQGLQTIRVSTQEEANQLAMEECEQRRMQLEINDQCRLHSVGNKYVYESEKYNSSKVKQINKELTEISPKDVKKYIIKNSDTKPIFIHFKQINQNTSKPLIRLAKDYRNKMKFLLVNFDTINNNFNQELKKYFNLNTLSYSAIVYKKKIILINSRSHNEKYTIKQLRLQIKKIFLKLKENDTFTEFGKGINGNNYYRFNAELTTKINTSRY